MSQKITYGKLASELQGMLKHLLRDLLEEISKYDDFELYNTLNLNKEVDVINNGISTIESAVDFIASHMVQPSDKTINSLPPYQRAFMARDIVELFIRNIETLGKQLSKEKGKELTIISESEVEQLLKMNNSILKLQSLIYELDLMEKL